MVAPVLVLAYNRPHLLRKVLERVLEARCSRIYVSFDGPADSDEDRRAVNAVRDLVSSLVPSQTLRTRVSEVNLGCRGAVFAGIDWFFGQEREGIVLEDDTLPSLSFFRYSTELLRRYRHDTRVMKVSGYNLLDEKFLYPGDYFFSYVSSSWGWASWSRAWSKLDRELRELGLLRNLRMARWPLVDWHSRHRLVGVENGADTWDYQWEFSIASQAGLHIVPTKNLVRNIGFGPGASHTIDGLAAPAHMLEKELIFPLNHGPSVMTPHLPYQRALRRRQLWESARARYRSLRRRAFTF